MIARIEPITLKKADVPNLQDIRSVFSHSVPKPAFLGPHGKRIPIPGAIYKILTRIMSGLVAGQAVSVIPIHQELTTQKAADLLGVSRQFLVRLLDEKKIPFHKSGTHRRIYLQDLLAYKQRRDTKRTAALDALADKVEKAGLAEKVYIPSSKS